MGGSDSQTAGAGEFIEPEFESEPLIATLDRVATALILNGQSYHAVVSYSLETLLLIAKELAKRNNPDSTISRNVVRGTDKALMDFFGE